MSGLTRRQEEASDRSRSLVVTAGAGSGKTKVLVERYIRILTADSALAPRNILALTFTEKAASEMRSKVRDAILGRMESDRERFEPLLSELEYADISTIHSFCTRLIRSEPLNLGLDPGFEVLTEARASTMLQEAIGSVFTREGPESASLRRLIVDYGSGKTRKIVMDMVKERARSELDPGSEEFKRRSMEHLRICTGTLLNRAVSDYPGLVNALEGLRSLPPPLSNDGSTRLVSDLIEVPATDPDKTFSALGGFLKFLLNDGDKKKSAARIGSSKVWGGSADAVRRHLGTIFDFAYDHRQYLRFVSGKGLAARAERSLEDLLAVFKAVDRRYSDLKVRGSSLDFDDMVDLSLRILREDQEGLRTRLMSQFRHIMVDEFQDTDPRQWELVKLLWDHEGGSKIFLVGDPKQSIYGFRSSDVRLFSQALKGMEKDGTGGSVVLDRNFRSRSEIMAFVNALFPSVMAEGNRWGVAFEPLEAHKGGGGSIGISAVEGREDCEFREGLAAARTVKRALREGWPVIDPEGGEERALQIQDIAVLFRGRTGLKHYERAFRAEGVPFVVYKGKGFYERQEISDILRMLEWLCTPTNDVALASVLKGPFFFLSDPDLLRASFEEGSTLIGRIRKDPGMAETVRRLDRYLSWAREYPVHIALPMIVSDSDLYACMGGRRECRNLDRALELFAGSEGRSIFMLRDELTELVEQGSREGEPPLTGEDAVTMMTVHAAKGLEWPMVLLLGMHHEGQLGSGASVRVDPDRGASSKIYDPRTGSMVETPSFVISGESLEDRETEEEKRLFYVACTRAKDHLVLSGRIPSPNDKTQSPPKGLMKLLLEPLGLDHSSFGSECVEVGGVSVKLELIGPALRDDDCVVVREVEMAECSFPMADPISPVIPIEKLRPSGDHERRSYTPPPPGRLSTPDQFGTMVHEVLMGRDPRRVAVENGFPEEADSVSEMAKGIDSFLPKENVEEALNEVCVVSGEGDRRVVGRIDRLLRMKDGSFVVVDFKTGSRKESYLDQVRIYMQSVEKIAKAPVSGIIAYPDGVVDVGLKN